MRATIVGLLTVFAFAAGTTHVAAAPPPPFQDIDDLLDDAAGSQSVARRTAAIRRLAEADNQVAAVGLGQVVREASDGRLRAEAARGLARMTTERAAPLLVNLIALGNTRQVREALGEGLAHHADGVERVVRRLATKAHDDALGRRLLVAALGEDPGPEGRTALGRLALGHDEDLRIAAMRALSTLRKNRALSQALAGIVLQEFTDPDTRVYALDLLADAELEALEENESVVTDLLDEGVPPVQRRAQLLLDRIAYLREKAERDAVRGTRYALPGSDPDEPRTTSVPVDVIFAMDTTYSEAGRLRRRKAEILDRVHEYQQRGVDLRVGFVAYRDHLRDENQRRTGYTTRELPLTFDIQRALAWLNSLGAAGVDTQGLAISNTLREGFARMNWRWRASREFHLIAGGLIDRPREAARTAKVHVHADRTALFFYGGRTPHNLALAKAAGIDVGTWQ